jgi:hydrogenase expression/formation protein HypC
VVSLTEGSTDAVVDLGGVRKSISIALVPEARIGDYVIVHVGHAIGMIDPEEAERTLALFGELAALQASEQQEPVRAEPVQALQPDQPASPSTSSGRTDIEVTGA